MLYARSVALLLGLLLSVVVLQQVEAGIISALECPADGLAAAAATGGVYGWAFSDMAGVQITKVTLLVDGVAMTSGTCCSERPDVAAAFPQFPQENTLNSGFSAIFDYNLISLGTHDIGVEIEDSSGGVQVPFVHTVLVAESSPFLFPLNVTCQGLPCTPYTANISTVMDHSGTPLDPISPGKWYSKDGSVMAYTGEVGQDDFGVSCFPGDPQPGYKNASGTNFLVNGHYVGARCPDSPITSEVNRFPKRFLNYDGHSGYDFPYPTLTPILAPADGLLRQAVIDSVNGTNGQTTAWEGWHTFIIDHIFSGNCYTTWYLHCTTLASQVWQRIKQEGYVRVQKGDVIAYVGGYGGVSPHLHFEVRVGMDQVVDPYSENLWE